MVEIVEMEKINVEKINEITGLDDCDLIIHFNSNSSLNYMLVYATDKVSFIDDNLYVFRDSKLELYCPYRNIDNVYMIK